MSESLKDIATKFRGDANGLEQEAARLKEEAGLLRQAAYTLNPVGRKPGAKQRKRKPFEETDAGIKARLEREGARIEPLAAPSTDKVEDVAAEGPSIREQVIEALRNNGEATAAQLMRALHVHADVMDPTLASMLSSGVVVREFDEEHSVGRYSLPE